jgi:hypothetical protein
MDRMGHAQITTTQKYLHVLPDADQRNLDELDRIRGSGPRTRRGFMATHLTPSTPDRSAFTARLASPDPTDTDPIGRACRVLS